MKKLVMTLVLFVAGIATFQYAQSGQSASVGILEVQCQGMNPTLGGVPMTLNIEEFVSPRKKVSYRIATLETDMQGHTDRLMRRRAHLTREKRPGSPLVYSGRDFTLEIQMTATPSTSGAYPATLTAEVAGGQKLVEPMVCAIYPMVSLTK
ncbi:MAG: hypothetical protein JNL01_01560 [Bdellovibrionales bacterium]|nr:hypothetical protein [Bdellovibrionales bacterium]